MNKKKENNKDRLTNIIIVLVFAFLIGSFVLMVVKDIKENSQNHVKEVSYNSYLEKKDEDKYTILLLARPNCGHCLSYKPLMNDALKNYNLSAVSLDVNQLNKDEFNQLRSSISAISNEYDDEGNPAIPTPTTVIFKNGVELESLSGNIGYDGFVNMLVRNGVIGNEN